MRRSRAITLTLVAGASLAMAGCDSEPDTEGVLESQSACIERLGDAAAQECDGVFRSSRVTHAATAPRYPSREACQAATGSECADLASEPRGSGNTPWASTAASIFIPAMAGVMIGRALSDGTRGAVPVYAGAPPPNTACPPEMQGQQGCPPRSSSSSSGSASSSGGGGRRYWYSGTSYAGFSEDGGRRGFRPASTSTSGSGLLARNSQAVSMGSRSGISGSRAGGLGFSAAAHSGGGS
ncbi:DUF1190 domain-containing protein [Roseomonas sp. WA12]